MLVLWENNSNFMWAYSNALRAKKGQSWPHRVTNLWTTFFVVLASVLNYEEDKKKILHSFSSIKIVFFRQPLCPFIFIRVLMRRHFTFQENLGDFFSPFLYLNCIVQKECFFISVVSCYKSLTASCPKNNHFLNTSRRQQLLLSNW